MIKVYWTRSYIGHDKIQQMGLNTKSMLSALRIEEPQPLTKHMDYQTVSYTHLTLPTSPHV